VAHPRPIQPTDLELEILAILWRDGPSTARQILDALPSRRAMSASSVHIVLNTMREKRYISREDKGRSEGGYHFRALVSQEKTAKNMLQYVIRKIFGGKVTPAMQNLLAAEELSQEELTELDALIRKKKREKDR